jgi:hypothetical protein
MQTGGCLAPDADPSRLASDTMAVHQDGLLLAAGQRDPGQLHIAVDVGQSVLHTASG